MEALEMVWKTTIRKDERLGLELQKIIEGGEYGMKKHVKYVVYDKELGEATDFVLREDALKYYRELKEQKRKEKRRLTIRVKNWTIVLDKKELSKMNAKIRSIKVGQPIIFTLLFKKKEGIETTVFELETWRYGIGARPVFEYLDDDEITVGFEARYDPFSSIGSIVETIRQQFEMGFEIEEKYNVSAF